MPSWIDRFRPGSGARSKAPRAPVALRTPATPGADATTQLHAQGSAILGTLVVDAGPAALASRRFVLRHRVLRLGRSSDCDIVVPDPRVSREHARLVPEAGQLYLEHRSHTNPTFLNGELVTERCRLQHGDHILLADDILLRLDAPLLVAPARPGRRTPATLHEAMEERVQLETRIREQFMRDGSFLDVDVVDSFGLKQHASPDRIVVSFERFRDLVERRVAAHAGVVLNSNGDEVMAYFDSADGALAAARSIAASLTDFNARSNLLERPFAVRMGIDTGRCAVDLERGVAYSPILDGAGHLQKAAPVGGALLSEATHDALSSEQPDLERVDGVGKSDRVAWRMRPVSS